MPVTISGDGGISGLGGLDGYDLQTQTLVVSGDTTIAPQAAGRASLFVDESTNTVGINTLAPNSSVFLEVADGTDPIVRVNNTGGGNLDIGSTTTAGYVRSSSGHELRLGSNAGDSIVLEADGDVNIDSNTLFVDVSSNNVGIGTNTPEGNLEIASAVAAGTPTLYLNRLANQADTSDIALVGNSVIRGANSITNVVNTSGYFDWRIGGTDVTAGISGSSSVFRINNNGNVGIGVTSTPGKLCIRRAAAFNSITYQAATINLNSQHGTYTNGEYLTNIIWARPSSNGGTANAFIGLRCVDNTGAAGALAFGCSTSSTVEERMCIDPQGNLLQGSTTSIGTRNYANSNYSPVIQTHGIFQNTAAHGLYCWSVTAQAPSSISLNKSLSGTVGTRGPLTSQGQHIGAITFAGDDGANFIPSAAILSITDDTPGTNNMPGRLGFYTTNTGSNTPTERMRIDKSGKVGFSDNPRTSNNVRFANQITGNIDMDSVINIGAIQTDVTSSANGFKTFLYSPAGTRTTNEVNHFAALQGTYGANHTVTSQRGFYAHSTLTGATNNYGFYSNIGSSNGRWNFYANGNAPNYFAGTVNIGTTTEIIPNTTTNTGFSFRSSIPYLAMCRQGNPVLILQRTSTDGEIQQFYRQTTQVGNISVTGSTTQYNSTSDYRLKENVVAITGAVDRVKALKPCRFNFIAEADKTVDGFLAHEAQEVVPEAVTGTKDGKEMQSMDAAKLVPLLTAALQESIARIDELQKEVNALKSNQVN